MNSLVPSTPFTQPAESDLLSFVLLRLIDSATAHVVSNNVESKSGVTVR